MNNPEAAEEGRETRREGSPTPPGPRNGRSSVPTFLIISFVLFMLTNNRGEELDARYQYMKALDSLNGQVADFSAWLHGSPSNFTLPPEDNVTMPLVSSFVNLGPVLDPDVGSYYTNLTGFWHGEVDFHNLTSLSANDSALSWGPSAKELVSHTNMTLLPELLGLWNWAATDKLSLSVGDKLILNQTLAKNISEDVAIIHGRIELSEPNASEELRLDFDGIHFVSNGSIYAFAETVQGRDLRMLPSLVPASRLNDTARVIEAELAARIVKLKEKIESGSIDQDALNDSDEPPKARCSFRLYGHLEPTNVPRDSMKQLEEEIEKPTGIWTVRPPEMKLDGVLVSQNCGVLFKIKETTGLKSPQLYRKITTYAGISMIVNFILLRLLIRETARISNAIGLNRVSRYTFLAQSLIDAISFVGHITLGILADGRASLSVLAPAGLACMLFINEAQLAVAIGQVQAPEDLVTPPAPSPAPLPAPSPAPPPVLPNPADNAAAGTPPGASPANAMPQPAEQTTPPTITVPERPSFLRFLWNHIRTDPSARLWTIISLFLIVVFRIVILLSLPLFFVASMYSFVWAVQIYRSVRRSRGSGLSTEYLVGTTICRLFFILYFMGCPKNILDVEPRRWVYVVPVLMFAQVATVLLQDRLGPTFFLFNRVVVGKSYDYHPPMPLPDPEAPEQTLGDCAICMDAIEVDPSLRQRRKSSDGKERGELGVMGGIASAHRLGSARKSYSLAPCHHLFHTACLERWLAIKNICPQCRRPLPPL
ncbi:uncharacterized protein C8Q71DRAFT_717557 [Rhodofomes roseus]|uniref:RING-type E3 ubiquitin transferase n=1 Tax=Rhodofomes roseus TaxID=34475 RepID=A0ABQ8K040_9APHY|nr:uncharacterized protein C8Q71DRAFT_717557 [Rhodofomes roseus]KAH9829949.1 hypothetical protein C8Q71DRAFT_717557 [Rhodofomes roseus]